MFEMNDEHRESQAIILPDSKSAYTAEPHTDWSATSNEGKVCIPQPFSGSWMQLIAKHCYTQRFNH